MQLSSRRTESAETGPAGESERKSPWRKTAGVDALYPRAESFDGSPARRRHTGCRSAYRCTVGIAARAESP